MGVQLETCFFFEWADWIDTSTLSVESIASWLERFERSHWQKTKKTDAALTTWKDYRLTFNRLDGDRTLTIKTLVEAIVKTEPDSRTCKKEKRGGCEKVI
ncbi:hypothetical protein OGM63_27760 [Plectonema radiosum NIES-515]|uniref:Uncharacterized protein n=1 Tax=Plectonema radiosum NIES-515 TaxID=2986073 RepID=A0ABT3B7A6_9CYAN|nr:hypothetical protein [Plectonema radiosum]MCV3217261.1 hypothetical protein [Plectonema radiosum NIES-515]